MSCGDLDLGMTATRPLCDHFLHRHRCPLCKAAKHAEVAILMAGAHQNDERSWKLCLSARKMRWVAHREMNHVQRKSLERRVNVVPSVAL
jgi:hypothetical protein